MPLLSPYDDAVWQRRLWTPEHVLHNCPIWYDAGDLTTLTFATGGVSDMRNKALPTNSLEQGTSGLRPDLGSLNGRPCLDFASGDAMMTFASAQPTLSSSFTFAIVCSVLSTSGANARAFTLLAPSNADYNTANGIALWYRSGANTMSSYANNGPVGSSTVADDTPHIAVITINGTALAQRVNGAPGGSGTLSSPSFGACQPAIAVEHAGTFSATDYRGRFCEALIVNGTPSQRLTETLEGYLWWEYRHLPLAPLAAGHPYFNRPPLLGM